MNIEEIRNKITPILAQSQIKRAGVFGSVVKGEATEDSDIDILVELKDKISLLKFVQIKNKLEDVLGKKIDLVEYNALKPRLKERILSEEVRIYG